MLVCDYHLFLQWQVQSALVEFGKKSLHLPEIMNSLHLFDLHPCIYLSGIFVVDISFKTDVCLKMRDHSGGNEELRMGQTSAGDPTPLFDSVFNTGFNS